MNCKPHFLKGLIVLPLFLAAVARGGVIYDFDVNAAIPDNTATGLQDTQEVLGFTEAIDAIQVSLRISGEDLDMAYNGDFYVTLQHDSGFAVLLNRTGRTTLDPFGYGNNGFDITFTLGGADIHSYQADSPAYDTEGRLTGGSWGVDGRNIDPDNVLDASPRFDMLANFTGLSANGNWTLFVADMGRNGNARLDSWGLNIQAVPEPASIALVGLAGFLILIIKRWKTC